MFGRNLIKSISHSDQSVLMSQFFSATLALTISTFLLVGTVCGQEKTEPVTQPAVEQETADTEVVSASATKKAGMSAADRIKAATEKIGQKKKYLLQYKMKPSEEIHWYHDHVITSKDRGAGVTTDTSSRVQSNFVWRVKSVDELQRMTFDVTLESVNMYSQTTDDRVDDNEPADVTTNTYNSAVDKKAPEMYVGMAERIGKPLSQYMVTRNGQIADSKSNYPTVDIGGIGETPTFAFPNKPIAIGHQWDVPDTLRVKTEHGAYQNLKVQMQYELMKVVKGNAYISFKTQVLTPLESARVRSQIVWHLASGYLVFNIERGLPIRREVEWDEKVQGFKGPDSYLKYTARRSERLIEGKEVSDRSLEKTLAVDKQAVGKIAKSKTDDAGTATSPAAKSDNTVEHTANLQPLVPLKPLETSSEAKDDN